MNHKHRKPVVESIANSSQLAGLDVRVGGQHVLLPLSKVRRNPDRSYLGHAGDKIVTFSAKLTLGTRSAYGLVSSLKEQHMSKIRIGMAVAIVCAVALTSSVVVAQDNSAREKDRAEIEELMWRYTRALDTGDGTTYARGAPCHRAS